MADFMDAITDIRGVMPVKVHGLRMLDKRIFKYVPLHSGDSTNAAVNGGLCMKQTPYPSAQRWQGSVRIAQGFEEEQTPAVWDRKRLVEDGLLEQ